MGKFRMKNRPQKPVKRAVLKRDIGLYEGISLARIIELLPEGVGFEDVLFSGKDSYWYDDCAFIYDEMESEESFANRLKKYEEKNAAYEKWAEENKEAIQERLAEKAEEARKKAMRDAERAEKAAASALKKALAEKKRIEKELAKLTAKTVIIDRGK
jgi:hypothetical protein